MSAPARSFKAGWDSQARYVIRRSWLPPFEVEVWENWGVGEAFKKGRYIHWQRIGAFFRRKMAEEFVRWHQQRHAGRQ